jgi:hypothetical protein
MLEADCIRNWRKSVVSALKMKLKFDPMYTTPRWTSMPDDIYSCQGGDKAMNIWPCLHLGLVAILRRGDAT